MNVKMLEDFDTYADGVSLSRFKKGDVVNLPEALAERLAARGKCEPTDSRPTVSATPPPATENADVDVAALREALAGIEPDMLKAVAEGFDVPDDAEGDELVAALLPDDADDARILALAMALQKVGAHAPAADPIEGMNAKNAAKAIAEFTPEQLDAIPADEKRKGVLDAVAARRAELANG